MAETAGGSKRIEEVEISGMRVMSPIGKERRWKQEKEVEAGEGGGSWRWKLEDKVEAGRVGAGGGSRRRGG